MTPRFCLALSLASFTMLLVLFLTGASGDGDLVIPVMLVASLVLGGVGYGVTKNKADAAHARLDRHETRTEKMEERLDRDIDEIKTGVNALRVLIEQRIPRQGQPQEET